MAKPPKLDKLLLDGPAGKLEAMLETPPDGRVHGSAVVCHPHPLHGGTMHNKVVHTLCRAFNGSRMAALRFNFRGVGASDGAYDEGRGEIADVLAAVAWIRARVPGGPMWLAGFSFGAAIAIRAALDARPDGLVSVAPAMSRLGGNLAGQPDCPWLIVQGDNDELVDMDETIAWVNSLEPGPEFRAFADTGHFFHGRLVELRRAVEAFVAASRSQGAD